MKSFAVIAVIVTAFFAYTFTDGNPIENMAEYSDYTRNAVLVASSNFDFMYGKLLMESEVYSRIPRAIWPDKPEDFGALYLAKVFFLMHSTGIRALLLSGMVNYTQISGFLHQFG